MRTLNLGILAHVDAGKTSLTERLLYAAGVIDEIGSVDAGSTQTDSLALERQRGITIKSAVVSFDIGDVAVNLIDTPGHPDFIAEVERVLSVLDGAVLVISAVEGVQAQTRVLMRTLKRLRLPTLLFVNKIDRVGARDARVLQAISEKLTPAIVGMGSVPNLGSRVAAFTPYGAVDAGFRTALADLLAERDDAILAEYVDETMFSYERLRAALATQTHRAQVHPVFFGSAITGAGVDSLIAAIAELLPATEGDRDGPVSGTVFKIERGSTGEKIAYVRMFTGTVSTRDRLRLRSGEDRKVTAIRVFERGQAAERPSVAAGRIGRLWGLGDVRIGDAIGTPRAADGRRAFAPPTLETVIVPVRAHDKGALHIALSQLAEQDPLINLRQDDARQELFVSLYGEVQKEVLRDTLAADYGIDVEFRETTMICVERPVGSAEAVELLGKENNSYLATVGLRIDPAPIDSGVQFRLAAERATIPLYVYKTVDAFRDAVDAAVRTTLEQGLYGWRVTDCTVTMTQSGYSAPGTTAADFRKLVPIVLMRALEQAGTVVCEPIHRFHLEIPADALGAMFSVLARLHAVPHPPDVRGDACTLDGEIRAARVHELQQQLSAPTRGEGVVEFEFGGFQPVGDDDRRRT